MTDFLSQLVRRRGTESPNPGVFKKEKLVSSDLSRSDEFGQRAIRYIIKSGLFDAEFYLASYPDIAAAGVDPFDHFFQYGFQEGRCPNPYFDPLWYLDDKCRCQGRSSATTAALRFCWGQRRTASIVEVRSPTGIGGLITLLRRLRACALSQQPNHRPVQPAA